MSLLFQAGIAKNTRKQKKYAKKTYKVQKEQLKVEKKMHEEQLRQEKIRQDEQRRINNAGKLLYNVTAYEERISSYDNRVRGEVINHSKIGLIYMFKDIETNTEICHIPIVRQGGEYHYYGTPEAANSILDSIVSFVDKYYEDK